MRLILKLIKFCLVGFSGLIIDFGTTYILKEKLRLNKYLSNIIGFILAASSNYILNKIWTFSNNESDILKQFSLFISIAIIGLIINNIIIYALTKRFNLNFYVSKMIAICIVTLWNFFMNLYITF